MRRHGWRFALSKPCQTTVRFMIRFGTLNPARLTRGCNQVETRGFPACPFLEPPRVAVPMETASPLQSFNNKSPFRPSPVGRINIPACRQLQIEASSVTLHRLFSRWVCRLGRRTRIWRKGSTFSVIGCAPQSICTEGTFA